MKTSWKFCVNGNLQRNQPVTARFHTQMVSNANASMSWRQHVSRGLNHSVSFYSQCPHQPSTILVSNFFTHERIVLLTINTLKLKLLLILHKCRNICQLVFEAANQQILVHFWETGEMSVYYILVLWRHYTVFSMPLWCHNVFANWLRLKCGSILLFFYFEWFAEVCKWRYIIAAEKFVKYQSGRITLSTNPGIWRDLMLRCLISSKWNPSALK